MLKTNGLTSKTFHNRKDKLLISTATWKEITLSHTKNDVHCTLYRSSRFSNNKLVNRNLKVHSLKSGISENQSMPEIFVDRNWFSRPTCWKLLRPFGILLRPFVKYLGTTSWAFEVEVFSWFSLQCVRACLKVHYLLISPSSYYLVYIGLVMGYMPRFQQVAVWYATRFLNSLPSRTVAGDASYILVVHFDRRYICSEFIDSCFHAIGGRLHVGFPPMDIPLARCPQLHTKYSVYVRSPQTVHCITENRPAFRRRHS